jgi:hypothetical protein
MLESYPDFIYCRDSAAPWLGAVATIPKRMTQRYFPSQGWSSRRYVERSVRTVNIFRCSDKWVNERTPIPQASYCRPNGQGAAPNYMPLAHQANNGAINIGGMGIPAGRYDGLFDKDTSDYCFDPRRPFGRLLSSVRITPSLASLPSPAIRGRSLSRFEMLRCPQDSRPPRTFDDSSGATRSAVVAPRTAKPSAIYSWSESTTTQITRRPSCHVRALDI